jgi:hypothetical protein
MSTYRRVLPLVLLFAATRDAGAQGQNLCTLFSTAEVTKLLGTPVASGEPLAHFPGCQWFGKDGESYVIVQVVDPTNWTDPRQASGYDALTGVGRKAYSHRDPEGGWRAMALTDKVSGVVLIGKSATRDGAVTMLRKLVGSQ